MYIGLICISFILSLVNTDDTNKRTKITNWKDFAQMNFQKWFPVLGFREHQLYISPLLRQNLEKFKNNPFQCVHKTLYWH